MQSVFENYDVFYQATLATTVLTNTFSEEAVSDCSRMIDFICSAYKMKKGISATLCDIILGELVVLSTTQDANAFNATKSYNAEYSERDKWLEVKCEIVEMLEGFKKTQKRGQCAGPVGYDKYYIYQPKARYARLLQAAVRGDLLSCREVGIMNALGIGCEKSLDEAARRFLQCALWGDVCAAFLLGYTMKLAGKSEKSKLFYELAELMRDYLDDGITVLNKEIEAKYSSEACLYFVYVASIKYDVVFELGEPEINYSFLEVMMSDDVPHEKKMQYINQYSRKEWRECTNSVSEKQKKMKIGF